MIKTELVNAMATKASISKVAAEKALKGFIETVTNSLKKKDKVSLVGFGSFTVMKRDARKGRNPQTGKEINIKACYYPKFRPGKSLKEAVK